MKNTIAILLTAILSAGCGSPELITLPSLSAQVPDVISILPKNDSTVRPSSLVIATFSKKIDADSLSKETLPVVENFSDKTVTVLEDELEDGDIIGIEGEYVISEDGFSVIFTPSNELINSSTYGVIITDKVQTMDGFSLQELYVSKFKVDSKSSENIDTESDVSGNISTEVSDDDVEDADTDAGTEDEAEEVIPVELMINEVLYDSSGSDTVGDLFVELKGTPLGDISGYKVLFINGDGGNITASVSLPNGSKIADSGFYLIADDIQGQSGVSLVSNADLVSNFDPHNGPDTVQLLNAAGALVDAVCYGNVTLALAENGLAMCEGNPAPDASGGKSISRTGGTLDSGDNATDFSVAESPTPGS